MADVHTGPCPECGETMDLPDGDLVCPHCLAEFSSVDESPAEEPPAGDQRVFRVKWGRRLLCSTLIRLPATEDPPVLDEDGEMLGEGRIRPLNPVDDGSLPELFAALPFHRAACPHVVEVVDDENTPLEVEAVLGASPDEKPAPFAGLAVDDVLYSAHRNTVTLRSPDTPPKFRHFIPLQHHEPVGGWWLEALVDGEGGLVLTVLAMNERRLREHIRRLYSGWTVTQAGFLSGLVNHNPA